MSALGQDFREDMVSIGEVSGEEGTERAEAVVESLAHVPDGILVSFGQGCAGGVHEHVEAKLTLCFSQKAFVLWSTASLRTASVKTAA